MKTAFKWIGLALLSPVLLFALLTALLYVPPIQNWAVQRVASYASKQSGMDISIDHVDLRFPLDLGIDGVSVVKGEDTIAAIERAVADVKLWPLLNSKVVLNQLELTQTRLNTMNFIDDIRFAGTLGQLSFSSPGIDLDRLEMALLSPRLRDATLSVFMSDTAAVDTTTVGWHIRFDHFDLERTRINVVLDSAAIFPDTCTVVSAYMHQARLSDGDLHLGKVRFAFGSIDWQQGELDFGDAVKVRDMSLQLDSLLSYGDVLRVGIHSGAMREVLTGLDITRLEGVLLKDSTGVGAKGLKVETPHSSVSADGHADFAALDDEEASQDSSEKPELQLSLDASLGKADLQRFVSDLPWALWPNQPLSVRLDMSGNVALAHVERFSMELPLGFSAEASGDVRHLTGLDDLLAQLDVRLETFDLGFLGRFLGLPTSIGLPRGLLLTGSVSARGGQQYAADLTMRQGGGSASVKGMFDLQAMSYDADVSLRHFNVQAFLPQGGLRHLSADATVSGHGTDPFSPNCRIDADVSLHHVEYGQMDIDSVRAKVTLTDGHALAFIDSRNLVIGGTMNADVTMGERIEGGIDVDLSRIDLQALGVDSNPLVVGMKGHIDLNTDQQLTHRISGRLGNLYIRDSLKTYHPEDVGLLVKTSPDTTVVRLQSGDLIVKLDAQGDYERLMAQLGSLGDSIASQLKNRTIDQMALREMLPTAHLYLTSEQGNPMADILKASANISFRNMLVDVNTSPQTGLNGQLSLLALNVDSTRIDTVKVRLADRGHGLSFSGQVTNNRRNPQMVFNALFDGVVQEHGASIGLRYFDNKGEMGLRIGAKAEMAEEGLRFHLIPERPTLGYKEFQLNPDNYLLLHDDLHIEAQVDLVADDGTGISVYTPANPADSELLQDLTVSLNKLDLGSLTDNLPFMPSLGGILNGDYHLMMDAKHQISVASDMAVKQMAFDGCPMGDIGMEFVYLQREDDSHALEAVLMRSGEEIGTLRGSYSSPHIDATMTMIHMPLEIANGFISDDDLIGLEGFADGEISLKGTLRYPQANGELYVSEAALVSQPYGVRLRFDDDPVRIVGSKLLLENFTMYAHNDNPLNIMGNIDFHDTENMSMDMRMRAQNFMLVNSKQKKESIAWGKMFVNLYARMVGPVDRLNMRGRLDVLGTTDLNYILLDSPLSTDNPLEELVKFTDFTDTTLTVVQRPAPDGLDMDLTLSIDQGAHVRCDLNAEQTNYVDLFGGGDLRMRYTTDGLALNGRYTVVSGSMKYSLPIIPLKTFTLHEGSYVEFTGDPSNPTLNLTATERTRATVGQGDGQTRSVAFDCGVVITKTLADMGLIFTIQAPEDMMMSSELSSMSAEERSKLAVTMLTTGMYLADGNTNGFSMNSALSSFLQKEINNLTAGALRTLDLEVGLDNTTNASGEMHTDYSFRFAKRFWNNRLKVQVGGKVSTGSEVQGQNQSFFDNVTMEYRLSPTSNQYVKLFYNQNAYDWLEGYTGEYGGGFAWKRKLDRLTDLFRKTSTVTPAFRTRTPTSNTNVTPKDSIQRNDSIK
ncbi:MAG: translocation/assembly module TamB [Prevotella sp.]|nr:translocation/assembly module TamB [Prevotella sp.]